MTNKIFRIKSIEINGDETLMLEVSVMKNNEETVIELLNPMFYENSCIEVGYKGGGPNALTSMILKRSNVVVTNDLYDSVLHYISKVQNYQDFELKEIDVIMMTGNTLLYPAQFAWLHNHISEVINYMRKHMINTPESLELIIRSQLPYHMVVNTDSVTFLNRDYNRLGDLYSIDDDQDVDGCLNLPCISGIKTDIPDYVREEIINNCGSDSSICYLYDDVTAPWLNNDNLKKYFDKLTATVGELTQMNYTYVI